jgi:prophage regulatory protein
MLQLRQLPATGFLRLHDIIGRPPRKDRNDDPGIPPIIPVCPATWWAGVRAGRYPPGVKLGPNATGWRVEAIVQLVEELSAGASQGE